MTSNPSDQYGEEEIARRRYATIKRMFATPPKPPSEMKVGKSRRKVGKSPEGVKTQSKKRYTVSLCDHIAGEFVPYKQIDIIASDDNNAIQKADEWVASIPELIEEETWLIIKEGARSIRPKKIK
jgi:hypothetical protein